MMVRGDTATRADDWLRRYYGRSAAEYDGWMRYYDPVMLGDGRWRTCARAKGRTLELAIGTGLNLPCYPRDVELTGIDLTPGMLVLAAARAERLDRPVELRVGNAQALDFPDGQFDTVVATFLLSTIPDPRAAAREAWRVLQPGGPLILLDHVRSPFAPVRLLEWLFDPLMRRSNGVDLLRDPLDYLGSIGFAVERCRRTRAGIIQELVARKEQGG
jgi:SAM-dependent methyltransferase